MKMICSAALLMCGALLASAATNELTGLMQKGLFEEEANHNLTAAMDAYQGIINRFDESRSIAASAIFRLGECYRKQGKTNEAANCYQRIVKEFGDQGTLLTLSEQNLGALGVRQVKNPAPAELQHARVAEIKKLPKEQQRVLVQQATRNPLLDTLMAQLFELQQKLAADSHDFGPNHPTILTEKETIAVVEKQIDEQVNATLLAWESGLEMPLAQNPVGSEVGTGQPEQEGANSESAELRRIQNMVKESPDLINAHDIQSGATPLHRAAAKGEMKVVEFLITHGADVNARDTAYGGRTPLHYAVEAGHRAMALLLLEKGARVSLTDRNGETPLHLAARRNFFSIAEVLIAHGADVNAQESAHVMPLHLVCVSGNVPFAELLLTNKAELNSVASYFQAGPGFGRQLEGTPLHVAVEVKQIEIVRLLLRHKAAIQLFSPSGMTPLDIAISDGEVEIASLLLDSGADPNFRRTESDPAPIHRAVIHDKKNSLALLLSRKADPNLRSGSFSWKDQNGSQRFAGEGYTPLLMCTRKLPESADYEDLIRLLIEHKADPNCRSRSGDTTLLNLLQIHPLPDEDVRVFTFLLDHGANPDLGNENGGTPLLYATSYHEVDCVKTLIDHKANVNLAGSDGETALHRAAQGCDHPEMLKIASALLDAGAEPNPQNASGNTPLSLVNTNTAGCQNMADLLREHGAVPELPDFNSIRLTRSGRQPIVIWREDTNHVNRFNLLETMAHYYWAPSAFSMSRSPSRALPVEPTVPTIPHRMSFLPGQMLDLRQLTFPDLNRITIHRPDKTKIAKNAVIPVNIMKTADTVDCASNRPLQFGDVIEIPEREHTITGPSVNLTDSQNSSLRQCLTQTITFKIKSKSIELPSPAYTFQNFLSESLKEDKVQAMLTSRSDFTRVIVHRANHTTGATQDIIEDVQSFWEKKRDPADDLWLRDGDVIEVPEK